MKNLIEIKWTKSISKGVGSNPAAVMKFKPNLWDGSPYYVSCYVCPECNKELLYKMRIRGARSIFNNQPVELFNLFTCLGCRNFYASVSTGNSFATALPLDEFALESEKYNEQEYVDILSGTLRFCNG